MPHKNKLKDNKVDYAILAAMPEELEFFIKEFSNLSYTEVNVEEYQFKIYVYKKNKILITPTGIGSAFAASILTLIYLYFKPKCFFICGTAGGINAEIKIGDVVIAEKVFEAEMQDFLLQIKDTPFKDCLKHPIKNKYYPAQYSSDPELLQICDSLHFQNFTIYKGLVVSSNAFPAPKELFAKIKQHHTYAIDMETAAFYQIAWLFNVKILAVRGISNLINSNNLDEAICESDFKKAAFAAAKVTLQVLDQVIVTVKDVEI